MSEKGLTRRQVLTAIGAGAASALFPIALGDFTTEWLSVERHELALPNWAADGFKAVFLADLHVNSHRQVAHAQHCLRLAMEEKPDAILLGGDFINASDRGRIENIQNCLSILADSPCPVVGVLGNHDYWVPKPAEVIQTISDSPIILLRNEAIEVNGVSIAGLDDAIENRHRPDILQPGKHSKSLICLLHEPDYVEEVPQHVSLQLSGHSHGGQICWPGGKPLHTPNGAKKYVKGFFPEAKVPLYVTRGVGTTGPEWRLFCRPELTVLTLRGT